MRQLALSLIMTALVLPAQSNAADGDVDRSFGMGGKVMTTLGPTSIANSVCVQPDGRVLVAGSVDVSQTSNFAVVRYNINGSLDSSFGTGGKAILSIGDSDSSAKAMLLQPDGKIILAGYGAANGGEDFAIVRLNSNGSFDSAFGTQGRVFVDFESRETVHALAIQADGKIIAVGTSTRLSSSGTFATARLNPDGSLDQTFGANGKTLLPSEIVFGSANGCGIQPDGRIVLGGAANVGQKKRFALARLNADGTLDGSFGANGISLIAIGDSSTAEALSIQSDGRILIGGSMTSPAGIRFALARCETTGTLDATFGINGIITTAVGEVASSITGLATQPDGKIIAAGSSYDGFYSEFGLARYDVNGSLDASFADGGTLTTRFTGMAESANGIAIHADGTFTAAGYYYDLDLGFAVARYNPDGALDRNFGMINNVVTQIADYDDVANAVVVQTDGKIVAAGYSDLGGDTDFALVRYLPNGTVDKSFGDGGIVTTDFLSIYDSAHALLMQNDRRFVAVGSMYDGIAFHFALARYNSDGSPDETFGDMGQVSEYFDDANDLALAAALQPGGKIVAAGMSGNAETIAFALVRYNADGSVDTSFGAGGKISTSVNATEDIAYAVGIQKDVKIVAAGSTYSGDEYDFAIVRYNSNGTLDSTFGDGGIATVNLGGDDYAQCMAIQSDGKIVVAGFTDDWTRNSIAVARLNADGSMDISFGTNGEVKIPIGSGDAFGSAISILKDGAIVIAGGTANDFSVVRVNKNGSLDQDFGDGGIVTTSVASEDDGANAVAIQDDGKIIAAGWASNGYDYDFALVRYESGVGGDPVGIPPPERFAASATLGSAWDFAIALQSGAVVESVQSADGASLAQFGVSFDADAQHLTSASLLLTGVVTIDMKDGAGHLVAVLELSIAHPEGNPNQPLIVSGPTATPNPALVNTSISFVTTATDIDGDNLSFTWEFGDGSVGHTRLASHAYSSGGRYDVKLTVSDGTNDSIAYLTLDVRGVTSGAFSIDNNSKIFLNLRNPKASVVTIRGHVPVPVGSTLSGAQIEVSFSGTQYSESFELNSQGISATEFSRFELRPDKTGKGLAKFKLMLRYDPSAAAGDTLIDQFIPLTSASRKLNAPGEVVNMLMNLAVDGSTLPTSQFKMRETEKDGQYVRFRVSKK